MISETVMSSNASMIRVRNGGCPRAINPAATIATVAISAMNHVGMDVFFRSRKTDASTLTPAPPIPTAIV